MVKENVQWWDKICDSEVQSITREKSEIRSMTTKIIKYLIYQMVMKNHLSLDQMSIENIL